MITNGDDAELALIENIQRQDLHPLDEARGIRNLMDAKGYTQGDVAKVLGKSRTSVNESLKLLDLAPSIQEACRTSDTLPPTALLLEIARRSTAEEQRQLWEQVMNGHLTVREARNDKRSGRARPRGSPGAIAVRKGRAFREALEEVLPDDEHFDCLVELIDRMHAFIHG